MVEGSLKTLTYCWNHTNF